MIHEVRKEYLGVCAALEPGFDPGCVHWPRKDALCPPVWTTTGKAGCPQRQNYTSPLPPSREQQQVHAMVDPCPSACPNHVADSTEETAPTKYRPVSPLLSTAEHEGLQDESVPSLPAAKDNERNETGPVSPPPPADDYTKQEVGSPLGGLQTSTLGSVSELSVSSSQLSLSAEEDGNVESEGCLERQGDANELEQDKEEEGGEAHTQLTNASVQCQLHSVTLRSSPPKAMPIKESPPTEVTQEDVHEAEGEDAHTRSHDAVLDVPEELFFREISAIIASAEQEGKSYEELKAQLELELVWVKQAIHSRQQASYCTDRALCVCVRACMRVHVLVHK